MSMALHWTTRGDGPPLLLLHGFTGVGADWDAVFGEAATGFTHLMPDLPGHGESPCLGKFSFREGAQMVVDDLPPAPPAADGFDACDTGAYRSWIGADIRETGLIEGPLLRIVRPGDLVTEDFRPDRANLVLTAEDRIARAFCG